MLRPRIEYNQVCNIPLFHLVADRRLLSCSQIVIVVVVLLSSTVLDPYSAESFYTNGLGNLEPRPHSFNPLMIGEMALPQVFNSHIRIMHFSKSHPTVTITTKYYFYMTYFYYSYVVFV